MSRDLGDPHPVVPARVEAHAAAFARIRADRRRLTQSDAEQIVRREADARGVAFSKRDIEWTATVARRSVWWPLLHPRQARRHGCYLRWPGRRSADH